MLNKLRSSEFWWIMQLLVSDRTSLYSCRYSLLFVSQGQYTLKTLNVHDFNSNRMQHTRLLLISMHVMLDDKDFLYKK